MMTSTGSTPLMPPLTTLLPLDELANRPSAMEPNRAGREAFMRKTGFHGSGAATLAKAVKPAIIIHISAYQVSGF